ncbi:MAG: S41 family peptidase [Patescibacteria group bacterium]
MKLHFSINSSTLRKGAFFLSALVVAGNVGYRLGARAISQGTSKLPQVIVNQQTPATREVDFAPFWDIWSRLESRYIDKSKIDPQKMVYGAISGMVASLEDPYTVFLPPQQNQEYKQDLNGTFEGIGAQLGAKDDKIVIVSPLKDHPAEKAGLKPGDWIVKVDGAETHTWTVPQAVAKIRGKRGSEVILTIAREGNEKTFDVSIKRDKITVKSVEVEVKSAEGECALTSCKVGYLKLSRFGDQTNDEWNSSIKELRSLWQKENLRGLILDLRNNPGGYLQSAIYVASEFLQNGVVVVQENSDGTKETYSVTRVGSMIGEPVMVLINKGSASAAEIVAGALRDHGRAKMIGETTFGKGSIQQPEDLPDGSGIHITTARWILPNGEWIDKIGIKPDIEVKNPEGTDSADLQLNRAIEELIK